VTAGDRRVVRFAQLAPADTRPPACDAGLPQRTNRNSRRRAPAGYWIARRCSRRRCPGRWLALLSIGNREAEKVGLAGPRPSALVFRRSLGRPDRYVYGTALDPRKAECWPLAPKVVEVRRRGLGECAEGPGLGVEVVSEDVRGGDQDHFVDLDRPVSRAGRCGRSAAKGVRVGASEPHPRGGRARDVSATPSTRGWLTATRWVVGEQLRHSDGGVLVVQLYGHPSRREAIKRIRCAYRDNTRGLRAIKGGPAGGNRPQGPITVAVSRQIDPAGGAGDRVPRGGAGCSMS
jgi:hypothetical protein